MPPQSGGGMLVVGDLELNPDALSFPELQEAFTDTTTPWHSDEAYWLDLEDKRALSFWFPMQDVNVGSI